MLHDRKWCAHREADQLWSVSLILLVILSRSSQCLIRSRISRGSELLHTVSTESSAGTITNTCEGLMSCRGKCSLFFWDKMILMQTMSCMILKVRGRVPLPHNLILKLQVDFRKKNTINWTKLIHQIIRIMKIK